MLKVGIVGCGKIADGHVEQARAISRAQVAAVCDQEPLMAEQLAVRLQVPAHYDDFAHMLAREALDVVHIATPPQSHVALACRALAAGCHVFVEKPFALDSAGTRAILDAAAQQGRCVCVNHLYNHEAPALRLQQLLRAGALGELVHLDAHYGYDLGGDYGRAVLADPAHWVHGLPGRLFHNVLDHLLAKLAPHLGDEVHDVQVLALRRRAGVGDAALDAMPDELRFLLRGGAVTASGTVSAHGRPVAHTLRVVGTRDTVELDYAARTLVRSARQAQPSALGRLFPPWVQAARLAAEGWHNLGEFRRARFHYFQPMRMLLAQFYDAIEHGAPLPIPPEGILRVARLTDRVVQALGPRP
jgi:predicted dehydrogenase